MNLAIGEIFIRQGKGRKPRTVLAGHRTRKALRAYLKTRHDGLIFTMQDGGRLTLSGLRAIVKRRARKAGVDVPSVHAFRHGFAINCLTVGMDVFSLQQLVGHADLTVLQRYLDQTTEDLRAAHAASSPVERAGL